MKELSATEAARHFSDVLDGVEYDGETFVIARHGRVVARLQPVGAGNGAAVKALLGAAKIDSAWAADQEELRKRLLVQVRSWSA